MFNKLREILMGHIRGVYNNLENIWINYIKGKDVVESVGIKKN